MSAEDIIAVLDKIAALTPAFRTRLRELLIHEVYRPHQVIDAPGNLHHRMWLVESGIVRSYYFDSRGKEITEAFFSPGELIFLWEAYLSQRTNHYLEALTITNTYTLRYTDLEVLRSFSESQPLIRHFLLRQRQSELFRSRLLSQSAEERYRQFRQAHPLIFREVPLRLIASYLNMTRENLSRLIGKN